MKVMLTGAAGQVDQALLASKYAGIQRNADSRTGGGEGVEGLLPLDLATADACREAVQQHQQDWVLNAAGQKEVIASQSPGQCPEIRGLCLPGVNYAGGRLPSRRRTPLKS